MHKKISVGLTVTIAIMTLIITAFVTTAVTMNSYSDLIADLPEREAMYNGIAEVDNIVRSNYFGDADSEGIDAGIASGYIKSLKTGVNSYMDPDEYAEYRSVQSGDSPVDGKKITTVSYKKYGSAGYIKISDFCETTSGEFSAACGALKDNSVTGIIIDVRDTDSANIRSAAEVIDVIVPLAVDNTKAIATVIGKDGKNVEIFSSESDSLDLPFAVLVNENTKGAGELVAADLRDFGKAKIVGKTTCGIGTYQKLYELSDMSAVLLTVGKIQTYSGSFYDGTGIAPDYDVDASEKTQELKNDNQFLQAYAVLSKEALN